MCALFAAVAGITVLRVQKRETGQRNSLACVCLGIPLCCTPGLLADALLWRPIIHFADVRAQTQLAEIERSPVVAVAVEPPIACIVDGCGELEAQIKKTDG